MSLIDSRVVEAKFNNSQFGKGVADTIGALDRLKNSLQLEGATKGLENVSSAATRFDASSMEHGAGRISASFSAMQGIALGALASIGAKAVAVGAQIASSLTIDPITAGFQEYETNMNSIQTILSNTKAAGSTLGDVNSALKQLNDYSDDTIYNFSEMAKNIGTFTAAGVNLDTSTKSIKGIANLAALSGSSSEQASTAMYQLSQAISAGRVSLEDWNSVQNAGMGGAVFQRALAQTAVAMGKLDEGAVTLTGDMKNVTVHGDSFRNSIMAKPGEESWLSSDVLTATLSQFTGDLSDAELAAQGFNKAQIEAIKAQAATAVAAATEVKTLSGLMDTLKESVGSGWSQTFSIIFGDFEESKTLFTSLNNSIGGFLGGMADSRNELLQGWKDLGGRTTLIQGLNEAFWSLARILIPIGNAFRDIFPPMTAQRLFDITKAFAEFAVELQPSNETMDRLRRTFRGLFAILGIGWEVIKAVAKFLLDMFRGVEEGDKGILRITATIGDWLVALHEAVKNGEGLTKFFDGLRKVLFTVINPIKDFGQYLGNLFSGADPAKSVDSLTNSLQPFAQAGERIKSVWGNLGDIFSRVKDAVNEFIGTIGDFFSGLGGNFDSAFHFDADTIIKTLQLALGGGLLAVLMSLKKTISGFSIFGGGGGGFLDSIKETMEGINGTLSGVTDVLSAMQANLRANALIKIAGAIAILAAAVFVLAGIDGPGLIRATTALTVMFIQLGVAMRALEKIGTAGSAVKFTIMSAGLILLSVAILILASAVKKLSEIGNLGDTLRGLLALNLMLRMLTKAVQEMSGQSKGMVRTGASLILLGVAIKILVSAVKDLSDLGWNELAKGLVGVGVLLGALTLFTKFAEANSGGLKQGVGLILLGVALKILASAVGDFAQYNWEELAQGMTGIAVGLAVIGGALRLIPESSLLKAASLVIVAYSLGLIADAVGKMADMSWEEIARGMVSMAGALAIIALALKLLPAGAIFSAAAIFVVAISLGMIGDALKDMATMSWEELARGLVGLAGSLAIIAIALKLMQGSIAGAAALIVVAVALRILWPVLEGMSQMSWGEIAKGLTMLAGVFLVLGLAGLVLAPIVPVLLGLGAAILLLGAGVILAGAGVMLFALALTALAAAGAAGTAAIVAIVSGLVGLIPVVMTQIGLGIIAFANVIATSGPAILGAITAVLNAFLQAIIDATPKVVQTLLTLLFAFLFTIEQAVPRIVQAGINILLALLDGIGRNIGKIVDKVVDIIVNFVNAISRNLPRVIQAGIDLIIAFMNGVGDAARNNGDRLADAGWNMASGIIEGVAKGLTNLAGKVKDAAISMAKKALTSAMDFLGIGSPSKKFIYVGKWAALGMAKGLDDYSSAAADSSAGVGNDILRAMGKSMSGLGNLINDSMDDLNPIITPVLDLSTIQRDSSQIAKLLGAQPINLDSAYARANAASLGYDANRAAIEADSNAGETNLSFIQNNTSPKALSSAEIYRQTQNQISVAKGALTTYANPGRG